MLNISPFFNILANIKVSHPCATKLLKLGAITFDRPFCPSNRASVNKNMEETFMRHSKSNRMGTGLSGICMFYGNYQRWVLSTSSRSQYANVILQTAGIINDYSSKIHKDTYESQKLKSERIVTRTQEAICS